MVQYSTHRCTESSCNSGSTTQDEGHAKNVAQLLLFGDAKDFLANEKKSGNVFKRPTENIQQSEVLTTKPINNKDQQGTHTHNWKVL